MRLIKYLLPLIILFLTIKVNTYRILGVFPLALKSHNIFFEAVMKGLANRGHKVDVVAHFELVNPPKNYRTILNLQELNFSFPATTFDSVQGTIDMLESTTETLGNTYGVELCELMSHVKMQDFIKSLSKDSSYEGLLVEGLSQACFYALGHLLNVPIITITPSLELPWINRQIGNPIFTSFYPNFFMPHAEIKTFWDRFQNTMECHQNIYKYYITTEPQTKAIRKYISPDMPTVREVERSVALSIVNTHHSFQGIRPTTPAFIEVGGLHLDEDNSTFTLELKQWMDKSKHGVVYFSIGTLVPVESLPMKTILAIYSSFAKLSPISVLMKISNAKKLPPGVPKNVLTLTWIPQIPVLNHKNTRVFITHGGLHGLQEAVYYGIPIIGIPLFYDQALNVDILVNRKQIGIQLKLDEITEESLDKALAAVLNDPKYREAAKNQSRLFRDRPMKPMDTANYWIEYVIRNGAQSLRSPAVDMYWWQVELLDVYGFLLICPISIFYVIFIIVRAIFRKYIFENSKIRLKND